MDARFFLQDRNLPGRVALSDILAKRAIHQKTPHHRRRVLRRRLTRGKLFRPRNTRRLRSDWLRAFYPANHSLWQEDSEDYAFFLFPTLDIRRLRIGAKGIAS